jgi:hypothetical protein
MRDNDLGTTSGGLQPAEGRDDLNLPGADRTVPSENPEAPIGTEHPLRDVGQSDAELRHDAPTEQVGVGMPTAAERGDSDLLPNVEVPDEEA